MFTDPPASLPDWLTLSPELAALTTAHSGRQRCLSAGDQILLIVHEVPDAEVHTRIPRYFLRLQNGEWVDESGSGLSALAELLDRYQTTIDRCDEEIDDAESAARIFELIRHSGAIARATRSLNAAIQEAVLLSQHNRALIVALDRSHEIVRAGEILSQDVRLALEIWQAKRGEEHQDTAERLNIIAGFFLPIVAMSGLLGMNVDIPPFLQRMFWVIMVSGAVLGAILLRYSRPKIDQ